MYKLSIFIFALLASCTIRNNKIIEQDLTKGERDVKVSFDKKIHNFGILSKDTLVHAVFTIKNSGTEDLVIQEVKPDCSCIEYFFEKDTLLPSKSTALTVDFSTKGKEYGLHRKSVYVRTNSEVEYSTLFLVCRIKRN